MNQPVFIKIDDFEKLKSNIVKIEETLGKARQAFKETQAIREKENTFFESWESLMDGIDEKVKKINDLLSAD